MERAKRLTTFWNYLPVFRVVAETEHISRAAKRLFVTPSAVSRTLAALEADVGQALFDRHGRSMKLNEAGRHLLLGVRTSMRVVDESLVAIAGETLVGRVRIATSEPFTSLLLPRLLDELAARHPMLVPSIVRVPEEDVHDSLLDGRIDVALVRTLAARSQVACVALRSFPTGVYVAKEHALAASDAFGSKSPPITRYVEIGTSGSGYASGWAVERGLRPALAVADFDLALAAVEGARAVAVLPEAMAAAGIRRGVLHRLATSSPPEVTMVGLSRTPQARPGRAEAVIDAARRIADEGASR